jgi:hypothetical protein
MSLQRSQRSSRTEEMFLATSATRVRVDTRRFSSLAEIDAVTRRWLSAHSLELA